MTTDPRSLADRLRREADDLQTGEDDYGNPVWGGADHVTHWLFRLAADRLDLVAENVPAANRLTPATSGVRGEVLGASDDARLDSAQFAIHRTDGENLDDDYAFWVVDSADDWSRADDQLSANDTPVTFEIVALVPVARRTFPDRTEIARSSTVNDDDSKAESS